ncbi:MAG: hypothetical protein HQL45_04660 [Alphaproteobacteria bacterium]|nr:hypothetical protein [Alphaproteobacteria bacterium]
MSAQNRVIVSGIDSGYFDLGMGLVQSIRKASPRTETIALLDLGLESEQVRALSEMGVLLLQPGWDYPFMNDERAPRWFRAMTARPHLPKHLPGFDTYVWIDSDAWVQDWAPVEALVQAARNGHVAIVEERMQGINILVEEQDGSQRRFSLDAALAQEQNQAEWKRVFGDPIADAIGRLPYFNSGVFALEGASPAWSAWSKCLSDCLHRPFGKMVEQQALNICIRRGDVAVCPQDIAANFLLTNQIPAWDDATQRFVVPETGRSVGIMHLCDLKRLKTILFPGHETDKGHLLSPRFAG